jgi:hypothetical protein
MEAFWTRTPDGKSSCGSLSLLEYGDKECEIDPTLIWGLNYSIRKKTLIDLGGFHPDSFPWELRRFRGDGETAPSVEAKRRGLKAIYQPGACVYHIIPANRMTVEYFEKRSYLQGISDSYTQIRRMNDNLIPNKLNRRTQLRFFLDKIKIIKKRSLSVPDSYSEIKSKVNLAYRLGYEYHQSEVRSDEKLLNWVLKENYWDEDIPGRQSA